MSDDWRLALGEHGPGIFEEAYQRKELLLKAGKLVAAGAVASPLLANVERAWAAAEAASAGGDPWRRRRSAAAKQYSGITLTTISETGPQAADDKHFGGPLWKKLTGINIKMVEGRSPRHFEADRRAHRPNRRYRRHRGAWEAGCRTSPTAG